MSINAARLLKRFIRYVQVETTANPEVETYPSSRGQLELGHILVNELREMGLDNAHQDENGLVWALIPSSVTGPVPTLLFNAHLDTSPDASGKDIKPQIIECYSGGDIHLGNSGQVIRPAECSELGGLQGHCLVTTDGTTLLGGDDKAGVSVIMEIAEHLLERPELPHGAVQILFTCDEEIGRGANYFDLAKISATAGYTLDGAGADQIEAENFSADMLIVQAFGHVIHPAIAYGRMVNAIRGLGLLLAELPLDRLSPETTCDREGFIHPYAIQGSVDKAELKFLLRDFRAQTLDDYQQLVCAAAERVMARMPNLRFQIDRNRQYRNMSDYFHSVPHVVDFALQAFEVLGRRGRVGAIRGGTDGAMFSERGLPTPNLSVGQHNIHSVLEFVSLDQMVAAVEHAVRLLEIWQLQGRS
ncbi:MAG: peptidase T [Planctomycetales bacterium]|nr:peptidase T [Planctomycetales bacterium]